jgi:hypothetical protein
MKRFLLALASAAAVAACATTAASAAALQNGNFETGNTSGWTTSTDSGSVVVTTGVDGGADASQFAVVTAGDQNSWQTLSQTFDATAGETLHLQAAFDGAENSDDGCGPYRDEGQVTISEGASTTTVFSTDACSTIGFGGWQTLSYQVPATGQVTVTAEVRNIGDGEVASQIFLDNVGFGGTAATQVSGIFLCYSTYQVQPGVWSAPAAAALMKLGYWQPTAVDGNLAGGTNVGKYNLQCNVTPKGDGYVDANGVFWPLTFAPAHEEVLGYYPH